METSRVGHDGTPRARPPVGLRLDVPQNHVLDRRRQARHLRHGSVTRGASPGSSPRAMVHFAQLEVSEKRRAGNLPRNVRLPAAPGLAEVLEDGPRLVRFHALRAAAASARSSLAGVASRVDGARRRRGLAKTPSRRPAARSGPNSKKDHPRLLSRTPSPRRGTQRTRASGIMSRMSCMTAALNSRSKCDSTLRGTRTVATPPARDAQTLVRPHRRRHDGATHRSGATPRRHRCDLSDDGPDAVRMSRTRKRNHPRPRLMATSPKDEARLKDAEIAPLLRHGLGYAFAMSPLELSG